MTDQPESPQQAIVFWQWDRRMARLPFLVLTSGLGTVLLLLAIRLFEWVPFLGVLVGCTWLVLWLTCCAQRAHDIQVGTWFLSLGSLPLIAGLAPAFAWSYHEPAWLNLIPLKWFGWLWYCFLLLRPGVNSRNQWGAPLGPINRAWQVAAWLSGALLATVFFAPVLGENFTLFNWL